MYIKKERVLNDIKKLSELTDSQGDGVTRFSFGQSDAEARKYIVEQAISWGYSVETDSVGNLRIFDAKNYGKKKIVTGSHIDSVISGGKYDGILGVTAGLEVLRSIREYNVNLTCSVELVVFAEEEGSNFGSTMTGSKFIAGIYEENHLDKLANEHGETMRSMLLRKGYSLDKINQVTWKFEDVLGMIELHVEQGPILDGLNMDIGIVEAIFGMRVIEIALKGTGNHAGGSPMNGRKDGLACAAEIILEIEKMALSDRDNRIVATVGKLNLYPNASNVIPEKVAFTVEVRDIDNQKVFDAIKNVVDTAKNICDRRGIGLEVKEIAESNSMLMDKTLIELIENLAGKKKFKSMRMNSGAVHDCCMIATKVKTAMIFVPSVNGRSHVPEEFTKDEHVASGAQLLLDVILKISE